MSWHKYAIILITISILAVPGCKKSGGGSSLPLLLGSFMSAAEPTFDLPPVWYTDAQTVTISSDTDGASFMYTTDGTDPKTSLTAIEGNTVTVDRSMTVQAYAFKDGLQDSDTVSITYRISDPKNICLVTPYGGGNPNFPRDRSYTITGPKAFGPTVFTQWRFDVDGNGTWDQDWQSGNTYATTYAASGMKTIKVEATDGTRSWLFDDNKLRVTEGVASNFAFDEINANTITDVYTGSIAAGDIDGDGDLDLIATGSAGVSNPVSIIYRNDGSGSFSEINHDSLAGVYNSSVALGDLDGDGDLDLVLSGWDSGSNLVSKIYQNDGSGSFTEINAGSLTGVRNSSLVLGDLDGDGDLDLVLNGTGISNGIIYRNDGDGGFTEIGAGTMAGVNYGFMALGDLDGDGDLDLVLTGYDTTNTPISKIYRNNGSGAFTEINAGSLTGVYSGSVALGDLDGDGDLDLILAGRTASSRVSKIYRNDGTGSFTEINAGSLTAVRNSSAALGDLDGDSDLDLVLSGQNGSNERVSMIYLNNGSGAFTEVLPESITGIDNGSIVLGDLNADGNLDLVLAGKTTDAADCVSMIYQATSMLQVEAPVISPSGGGFWSSQTVTITTGTAGATIKYTTDGTNPKTSGTASTGSSGLSFSVSSNTTVRAYAYAAGYVPSATRSEVYNVGFTEINPMNLSGVWDASVALGDIDGDGDLDLIIAKATTRSLIYQNDGSGYFTEINAGSLAYVDDSAIALGDIDGDGDLDLILTGTQGSSTGLSIIYQNDGTGSFSEISAGSLTGVYNGSVALGDIDGDGDLDLILTGQTGFNTGTSKIYRNTAGAFAEINAGSLTGVYNSGAALGDLDGDADLDLILAGNTGSGTCVSRIYQNNGSGAFTEINAGTLGAVYEVKIALGNLDGDADLDLILVGRDSTSIAHSYIYQNDGSGGFAEINAGSLAPITSGSIALGDIDGDGDRDLIMTGTSGSPVTNVYMNNGSGSFSLITDSLYSVTRSAIALGDINGDSALDLILTGSYDPPGPATPVPASVIYAGP